MPQDVAVYDDRIYVAALARGAIQVFDATDLHASPREIDLSSYDPDGSPGPGSVYVLGHQLYVTLGKQDPLLPPRDRGVVVVLDAITETVEAALNLEHANPTGLLRPFGPSGLVVATSGGALGGGCVEHIVTSPPSVAPCIVDLADLAGTVNATASAADDLYLAVTGFDARFDPVGRLIRVRPDSAFEPEGIAPPSQVVQDIAYCPATGQLVYSDQAAGGLRVWDVSRGHEITPRALDLGLPMAPSNALGCYSAE
jgi:hypothetical protein